MLFMLCRNRVTNYEIWKQVFDSHNEAHLQAGLHLINLWREVDEPNNVFFLFNIDDIIKAKKFISDGEKNGNEAGVIDFEMRFIKN